MVRSIVDLDIAEPASGLLVLQEVVDTALTGLPDTDTFVVPDLAIADGQDDFEHDFLLNSPNELLDQAWMKLAHLAGKLARLDERTSHVDHDILSQLSRLTSHAPDVVVGTPKRPTPRTRPVARVLLCGVVELTDDSPTCGGHQVFDLLFVEKLVERDLAEQNLGDLPLCGLPIGPSLALTRHRPSRDV